jgi:hypothetical protein
VAKYARLYSTATRRSQGGAIENLERLRGLESDGDDVAVFVWPDSFPKFRLLKEFLVGRKFGYRLVPMTPNE